MLRDPLLLRAIDLLARGHSLYGPEYFDAGLSDAPGQLQQRAVRHCQGDCAGMGAAADHVRTAAGLRRIAAADSGRMWLNGVPFHPADYGAASRLGVSRVFQEQALVLNVPVYENLVLGHEHYFDRMGQLVDKAAIPARFQFMPRCASR